jgi:Family of unknown function (DUF5996)
MQSAEQTALKCPDDPWPPLPQTEWSESCVTLQLWTQIVGKVRLALTPPVNHTWNVTLYPTIRGLTTWPTASYPGIAADYEKTFVTLKGLPCDIFLGAHGQYFNMLAKLARAKAGAGESVWIDPNGYKAAVAEREQAFEAELEKQTSAR